MRTTQPKSRGWLVTLSAAVVFALYLACFFVPGQKSIAALRKQTSQKRQAITTASVQAQSLADLEKRLECTNRVVRDWQHVSPGDPHVVELFGKLASLAKHAGVRVNRLSPQEPIAMAVLRQHPLVLHVEGTFVEIVDYLGRLESQPETIWVRQLEMKPSSENGRSVQCDLMLTVFADNREVSG